VNFWSRWLSAVPAWVWATAMTCGMLVTMGLVTRVTTIAGAQPVSIAEVRLAGQTWAQAQTVGLPHAFDERHRRWNEEAHYRIALPQDLQSAAFSDRGLAMLLPRVGVRFRVTLNGHELVEDAWHRGEGYSDSGTYAQVVPLLPALLSPRWSENELVVEIRGEALRISGLSQVWIGPSEAIWQRNDWLHWWQIELTWMVASSALLLGTLSLLIWMRTRESLFGLLAGGLLILVVRLLLSVQVFLPGPFWFWDYLHKLSFTWYCGYVYLFMYELFDFRQGILRRLVGVMMQLAPVWMMVLFFAQDYVLYRAWMTIVVGICVLALLGVIQRARWGLDASQRLMVVVGLAVMVTGLRDYLVVQMGFPGDVDIRWMTPGSLILMFAMGWVLLHRSVLSLEQVGALNEELSQRVRERERELQSMFDRLRQAENQRVVEAERRRLTRDMHDGLGSQLVQTLNLLRSGGDKVDRAAVSAMVVHALDDLRMTLDSLEPMDGDLATILGTLRMRIAPALDAAKIELVWAVEDVPAIQGMEARGVMHLFRCLQEVFANVVKHAHATRVTVSTGVTQGRIVLSVCDNGVGLGRWMVPGAGIGGRGIGNIRIRAAEIGAEVEFAPASPGTCVRLSFPLGLEGSPPPIT
jgi:signal transduction histidine kinase